MTSIRIATEQDAERIGAGLRRLGQDLSDPYRLPDAVLARALAGPSPVARVALAEEGDVLVGFALYNQLISTSLGGTGAFISDLWVAPEQRSTGLGRRLLAAALVDAKAQYDATYLRLTVYEDNPRAHAFYKRLGFVEKTRERGMVLSGAAAADLVAGA